MTAPPPSDPGARPPLVGPRTGTGRVASFAAGPAVLPEPVLRRLAEDLWDLDGSGAGILETPHRGAIFDHVLAETVDLVRRVGGVPDDFEVLFLQGGATMQFVLVPMNLLAAGGQAGNAGDAAFLHTGRWTALARREAARHGRVRTIFDGEPGDFRRLPAADDPALAASAAGAAYVHWCSNNTVVGTQWPVAPVLATADGARPTVVCDMSSDAFSRPVAWDAVDLAFAGAQKNLGPAGTVLVVVRRALLEHMRDDRAPMLSYRAHAEAGSRLNTPPTFGIHVIRRVLAWLEDEGGLDAAARRAEARASLLYDAIDASDGFWRGHAEPAARSRMNVVFRGPDEDRERAFVDRCADAGLVGLHGHRSVGGLRASIYNACPMAHVERLAEAMRRFRREA